MATVQLKTEASRGKWGHCVVYNTDGTLNREFKITAIQLVSLHNSGNSIPPGMIEDEWISGRAVIFGKDYDSGDIKQESKYLFIKINETMKDGHIVESYLKLLSGEWKGTLPDITVEASILTAIQANLDRARSLKSVTITSIIDGLVEYS